MSVSLPHPTGSITPSLHPAISRATNPSESIPTIPVCPLPLSSAFHQRLIPELSHELKTPLTGILGLAQMLQRPSARTAQRERQYADLIYQKSHQLLLSINDLLDLAQLSQHQLVLELRPVSLLSILKTALQTVERVLGKPVVLGSFEPLPEGEEGWMMGDRPRLEQLFAHLLSVCSLEPLLSPGLTLRLQSHGRWLALSLTLRREAAADPDPVFQWFQPESEPHQGLSHSSAALKLYLVQQLAQWQGGDLTGRVKDAETLEVTVLLPQDLTQATPLKRVDPTEPLILLYSPQATLAAQVAEVLCQQSVLVVIARSPLEVQEKLQILAPTAWVLDPQSLESADLSPLSPLQLATTWPHPPLIWLNTRSAQPSRQGIEAFAEWSWPLHLDQVQQTLRQLQQLPAPRTSTPTHIPPSQPLVLLQIDPDPSSTTLEPLLLEVLTQLSKDFNCSILAVEDREQAELLARIWKPKVMLCADHPPVWISELPQDSPLRQFPLLCLHRADHNPPAPLPGLKCQFHPINLKLSNTQAAKLLHQALTQTILS